MTLSEAEFAYLYYPSSPQSRPPYSLEPDLMWMQISSGTAKGLPRLVRALGDSPARVRATRCEKHDRQGANVVHHACVVDLAGLAPGVHRRAIFGSIVERDGRFKFVSLANRL